MKELLNKVTTLYKKVQGYIKTKYIVMAIMSTNIDPLVVID